MITQACKGKQLGVERMVEGGTDFYGVKRNICVVTGATRQTRSTAWSRVTNQLRSFVEEGVSSLPQLKPSSAVVTQVLPTRRWTGRRSLKLPAHVSPASDICWEHLVNLTTPLFPTSSIPSASKNSRANVCIYSTHKLIPEQQNQRNPNQEKNTLQSSVWLRHLWPVHVQGKMPIRPCN